MAEPGKLQDDDQRLYLEDLACRPALHQRHPRHRRGADQGVCRASSIRSRFTSMTTRRRRTLFGGLAASGWHTMAITMRLLVESGLPLMGGIVGAGGEISWPKPTRPGDILQVVSEVEEVVPSRSRPDRGMVKVRSETRNQRGEVVQVLMAKLIVPRRAATSPQPQGGGALQRGD